MKKPHPLLDAIMAENNIKRDSGLSELIGVQRANISKIRNGVIEVSDSVRIAVMRSCKWSLKRVDELAPPQDD